MYSHNEHRNRRRFAAELVAAASGLACFSQLPVRESRAANEKLKLGFVGVGNRGRNNLLPMRGEEITALCDVDKQHLDQRAAEFPAAKTYRDFRLMLSAGGLDGVVISAPNHIHGPAASMGLSAGMHVYCEKPLAHTVRETARLALLAGEKSKKLATQLGNQHHSSRGYQSAIKILRKGLLGPIKEIHSWTAKPFWPQGIRRPEKRMPAPQHLDWNLWLGPARQRPYHSCYLPLRWRGWWDFGSGALGDMGPHLLDPVVAGLKITAPLRVAAETDKRFAETAPKWSIVRFQLATQQAQRTVNLTWYDGGKSPPRTRTGLQRLPSHGSLVIGERGKLFIPQLGGMPILLNGRNQRVDLPKLDLPDLPDHHRQWLTACRMGKPGSSSFSYGARLTAICLLGNLSVRTGLPFQWDPKRQQSSAAAVNKLLAKQYRAGWELANASNKNSTKQR